MPASHKFRRLSRGSCLCLMVLLSLCLVIPSANAVTEVGLLTWKASELHEKAIEGLESYFREANSDVVLVRRDAGHDEMAFMRYLRELYERDVRVLVVVGSRAAQLVQLGPHPETGSLPTVALAVSDPATLRLEGPEERAGYPLTGVSYYLPMEKHLALFSTLLPQARRISFLYDPDNLAGRYVELPNIRRMGKTFGYVILPFPVSSEAELPSQAAKAAAAGDIIVLATNKLLFGNVGTIMRLAGDVPVFSLSEEGVPAGAVAAVYLDRTEMGRMAGRQVTEILGGVQPRQMPFAFPRMEKLSVNLSSARRWGILVPRSVMDRPSMIWRSSSHPEWYREDGEIKDSFQLVNDPDGHSFLRIGLVCQDALRSRPYLSGLVRGLRRGSSNYEVEAVDCARSGMPVEMAVDMYQKEVDLIVVVGEAPLEKVRDRNLPVPVVFTGAFVSDSMALGWKNRRITGSTCNPDPEDQVALLEELFGKERSYLVTGRASSLVSGGEGQSLFLEMLTSGFSDVEQVGVFPALAPRIQARRLFRAVAEKMERREKGEEAPVLVVTEEGKLYHSLPFLGDLLAEAGFAVPVYVTSGCALQWGGTVAPDVDSEGVGLAAGRYAVQILEQGIYPGDLPVWRGKGMSGLQVSRKWKEISRWEVPAAWDGQVKEVVTVVAPGTGKGALSR